MATSGTTVFTQTRDQIIRRAGRQIGAWQSNEVPSPSALEDWTVALNAMIKAWEADGIHVWKESEATLFLAPGQVQYTIGPDTTNRICKSFTQLALGAAAAPGSNQISVGYGSPLLALPMPSDTNSDISNLSLDGYQFLSAVQGQPAQMLTANGVTIGGPSGPITIGDFVGIFQLDGSTYWTQITGLGQNSSLQFLGQLPIGAAPGAVVITYPAGPTIDRPLRILDARRYDILSQQEVSLNMLSRLDYRDMPNKFTSGYPNSYFYDPQLNDGQLWVWSPQAPIAPASGLAPNGDMLPSDFLASDMLVSTTSGVSPSTPCRSTLLNFTYMSTLQSFINGKDNPDFPEEWLNALTWNLAAEMLSEYGTPERTAERVERRAEQTKEIVAGWDREPESIYCGVNFNQTTR